MRVLVTGAGGMLGREVVAALDESGHTPIPTTRAELDVTDVLAIRDVLAKQHPDRVIHCAAFTAVDKAELAEYRDEVVQTNAAAPGLIASTCSEFAIPLCHISTDFVFSGRKNKPYVETDTQFPLNEYALSKQFGEESVVGATNAYWIIRTAWLFGQGKCFPDTILNAAQTGKPLRVVNDQTGCPTYTADLARNLVRVIESAPYGTYHLVNRGQATWYEFACKTLELAGIKAEITPIKTEDWPTPAKRPRYSVLSCEKLEKLGLYEMRLWQEALAAYVRKRYGDTSRLP